jgi:hypothetical protein
MDAHLLRLHPRNLDHVRRFLDVGAAITLLISALSLSTTACRGRLAP